MTIKHTIIQKCDRCTKTVKPGERGSVALSAVVDSTPRRWRWDLCPTCAADTARFMDNLKQESTDGR